MSGSAQLGEMQSVTPTEALVALGGAGEGQGGYLPLSAGWAPRGTGCERGRRPHQGSAFPVRRPAEEEKQSWLGGSL